jgi:hypothetical protein
LPKRELIDTQDRERQQIVDYLASQAPDELVEHLEKVKSERVLGRWIDVWDVHTHRDRWWVITAPTNLYLQSQFPSLEIALSFHVGLTARVSERQDRTARPEQAARFAKAWRAWEQAGEALAEADEAEEFQAVGMRCRQSLLAFVNEAASLAPPSVKVLPKAGDFVGWSDLLAETIAAGSSAERKRGYLKSIAKSTWELVNWLTHAGSAGQFDAHFSYLATEHALSSWSVALMRFEFGVPDRCPKCSSYKLVTYSRPDKSGDVRHFTTCDACGWKSRAHGLVATVAGPSQKGTRRTEEDGGPCVFVEVPLRGPQPPKPTHAKHRSMSYQTPAANRTIETDAKRTRGSSPKR